MFAAVMGVGDILEHALIHLEGPGRDVSPILSESQDRIVIVNVYDPQPVSVQVVQVGGPLERMTEVLGSGVGLAVLSEVRRAVKALDLDLALLSDTFRRRISHEKATVAQTYALFRGSPREKEVRLSQVLRSLQDKHRRQMPLLRELL